MHNWNADIHGMASAPSKLTVLSHLDHHLDEFFKSGIQLHF
jgi:hypothetical protein